jgi:hypothetical protein
MIILGLEHGSLSPKNGNDHFRTRRCRRLEFDQEDEMAATARTKKPSTANKRPASKQIDSMEAPIVNPPTADLSISSPPAAGRYDELKQTEAEVEATALSDKPSSVAENDVSEDMELDEETSFEDDAEKDENEEDSLEDDLDMNDDNDVEEDEEDDEAEAEKDMPPAKANAQNSSNVPVKQTQSAGQDQKLRSPFSRVETNIGIDENIDPDAINSPALDIDETSQEVMDKIEQTWSRLDEEDIGIYADSRDQFLLRLQDTYGLKREEADRRLSEIEKSCNAETERG